MVRPVLSRYIRQSLYFHRAIVESETIPCTKVRVSKKAIASYLRLAAICATHRRKAVIKLHALVSWTSQMRSKLFAQMRSIELPVSAPWGARDPDRNCETFVRCLQAPGIMMNIIALQLPECPSLICAAHQKRSSCLARNSFKRATQLAYHRWDINLLNTEGMISNKYYVIA